MGGFGSVWHWVIVLLVIVLLFGAKKIPELAKGLGSGIKNFKKAVKEDEDDEDISEIATQKAEEKPKIIKDQVKNTSDIEVESVAQAPKKRGRKPKTQIND
ncbi:Sec-independent protein translocase TatA [Helicobacter sp. 12S02232-10]|uniref:twin-arginine translocase TatA/TatE family subunit n=1 Tax=Helicobacter sp. 12S02232-10 TaxID=1476197 RepID=UPI000BCE347B|nr:twin-arginine translocase TatA/TatE family subunit [Helicobacter sp. 12S02232-10]PAF47182.1 Sec-independent protein translocase TatA [Helicobacter sp. 12S02232-10]